MKPLFDDTHPKIEKMLIEGYRKMSSQEKMQRICQLNQFAYNLVLSSVKEKYPNASEHEIKMRVASRSISPELMLKAFGWDVAKEGY
jgi:hypothetical protein